MRELVIMCDEVQAEAISDALLELGVLSVSVEDADRDTEDESPLFGEPGTEPEVQAWQHNRVIALLPDEFEAEIVVQHLKNEVAYNEVAPWEVREVPDEDWVRLTQAQFEPIAIGSRIWIVPSWHMENSASLGSSDQEKILIELDPGLAFGTGSHPTTHLCAAWLEANVKGKERVLDYGCGSGILAIVAKKLGTGETIGVDIDDQAVTSTQYNAENNQVQIQALLPDGLQDGTFDLVVANILSNPLKVLAPMLSGRVNSGGHLILSGVLERQAQEVAQAYAPWIDLSVWKALDGWVCLHGIKK